MDFLTSILFTLRMGNSKGKHCLLLQTKIADRTNEKKKRMNYKLLQKSMTRKKKVFMYDKGLTASIDSLEEYELSSVFPRPASNYILVRE